MHINQRIVTELKNKSLKQNQLCEYIQVANSTLNNWLKLNRSIPSEYIFPISEFLSVDPIYLLTGKETSKSHELSEDVQELINVYEKLDGRGKTMVKAKAYEEQDRMEGKSYNKEYGQEIS